MLNGTALFHPSSGTKCYLLPHKGEGISNYNLVKDENQPSTKPSPIGEGVKPTYSPILLFTYSLFKKCAFTLAEVLITLGIIGVVAAMTLPTLINMTNKKELEVALKKTYSELNQASMLFKENEGYSVADAMNGLAEGYQQYKDTINTFIKYFQGGHKYSNATHSNVDEIEGYIIHFLDGRQTNRLVCNNSGYYTDNTGRIFAFNDGPANSNENGPVICVDTNGEKRPNRYGYDIFLFLFTIDGHIIPMGQEHKNNPATTGSNLNVNGFVSGKTYCSKTSSSSYAGYGCAVYAINDTHPAEQGKTYWKDFIK